MSESNLSMKKFPLFKKELSNLNSNNDFTILLAIFKLENVNFQFISIFSNLYNRQDNYSSTHSTHIKLVVITLSQLLIHASHFQGSKYQIYQWDY